MRHALDARTRPYNLCGNGLYAERGAINGEELHLIGRMVLMDVGHHANIAFHIGCAGEVFCDIHAFVWGDGAHILCGIVSQIRWPSRRRLRN